jgi:hypothetical protein
VKRLSLPLLLALAGGTWTAGQAVLPDMGADWPARLTAVAAARPAQALAAGLFVLAGALLVAAAVAARARVPSTRGAAAVHTGVVLLALGGIWLAAGRGAFNLLMYRLTDPAIAADARLAVASSDTGPGFVVLVLMLPALLLAPVVLAAGAVRAGAGGAAWGALACWLVGIAAFVVSEFSVKAAEVAGVGIAAIGLMLLAAALNRLPAPAVRAEERPLVRGGA